MQLAKHKVYRAIEGWAHGFPWLARHELTVLATTSAASFGVLLLSPLPIGAALVLAILMLLLTLGCLVLLRYRLDSRRDALVLLWRRRHPCRCRRMLDDDTFYRPYRGR